MSIEQVWKLSQYNFEMKGDRKDGRRCEVSQRSKCEFRLPNADEIFCEGAIHSISKDMMIGITWFGS